MALNIKAAFKQKWVKYSVIGILVLGVFYLGYKKLSGGSSSAATTTSGSNAAAVAQANALQAQQNTAQLQASTAITTQANQITGQQNIALIQAGVQKHAINAATAQTNLNDTAQIAMAQINSANVQKQIAAQESMANAATAAQVTLGQQQTNAITQINKNNDLTAFYTNQTNATTQVALANTVAAVQNAQTQANVNIAAINANTAQVLSTNSSNVSVNATNTAGHTASTGLIGGFVGNLLGGLL